MKIAFDLTSVAKAHRGGIATYGHALVSACARVAPQHEYVLAVRPNRWTARGHLRELLAATGARGVRPLLDAFPDASLSGADVLHSIGVRLPPRGRCARVVTLHDLNVFEFPELSDADWREQRQARIRQTVARADLIIAYSEQGRSALAELLAVDPARVAVIPCGVDTQAFARPPAPALAAVLARHGLLDTTSGAPRPYIFSVGEFCARKNQVGLLEAFARAVAAGLPPDWLLVLGGPRGAELETLRRAVAAAGLPPERVLLPGWIPDADLPGLLAGAGLYVCAALHEGFGLPVIEAQAAGAPVLCSNRGALPETLGGVGVLFDPGDPAAFAAALLALAADAPRRAELARAGPLRAARDCGWDAVARRTLQAYSEALSLRALRGAAAR